ncbi:MAG: hypothetical protein H7A17_07955 [Sinobacteraceae bacterium]|nr:hypothetical protein [Nevskiaceae bacterium]
MSNDNDLDEFGQQAGRLLRASANDLDAATRAALARARASALEGGRRPRGLDLRYLVPAGALASAALVAVLFLGGGTPVNDNAGTALLDLSVLADADALELGEETDLEFIEWAAAMARQDAVGG